MSLAISSDEIREYSAPEKLRVKAFPFVHVTVVNRLPMSKMVTVKFTNGKITTVRESKLEPIPEESKLWTPDKPSHPTMPDLSPR